jgi:hypothetical protein
MPSISREDRIIWDRIVAGFCREHDITPEQFTKIIAFCYRGWGDRYKPAKSNQWKYCLNAWFILDCTTPFKELKREFDKSIRLMKKRVDEIDYLWDQEEVEQPTTLTLDGDLLDVGEEIAVDESDRLLYGTYEED